LAIHFPAAGAQKSFCPFSKEFAWQSFGSLFSPRGVRYLAEIHRCGKT
jgi:hypothetical protein